MNPTVGMSNRLRDVDRLDASNIPKDRLRERGRSCRSIDHTDCTIHRDFDNLGEEAGSC